MERTLESVSFQEDTSSLTAIAHEWQETRRATAKNAGSASSLVSSSASSEPSAATAVEEDDAQQLRSTSPVKRRRASRSSTSTSNSEDSSCNLLERGMVVDSNGNLCVWWLVPCTHMYRWLRRLIFITVIGRVDGWMDGWMVEWSLLCNTAVSGSSRSLPNTKHTALHAGEALNFSHESMTRYRSPLLRRPQPYRPNEAPQPPFRSLRLHTRALRPASMAPR